MVETMRGGTVCGEGVTLTYSRERPCVGRGHTTVVTRPCQVIHPVHKQLLFTEHVDSCSSTQITLTSYTGSEAPASPSTRRSVSHRSCDIAELPGPVAAANVKQRLYLHCPDLLWALFLERLMFLSPFAQMNSFTVFSGCNTTPCSSIKEALST